MIFDRYGTIDRGTFTYYPGIVKAGKFYGFDPADPVYRQRAPRESGWRLCRTCRCHNERDRSFPCDVMKARARDMEADGYPATTCRSCGYTMPVRLGQSPYDPRCFYCERMAEKHRRPRGRDGGVYVPDGLGCVEKIPGWMVDWDGNLSAGGGVLS